MDSDSMNTTKSSNWITLPTFIWCFLMPSIHFFSLISNILCIIVFCSNIFIKRPIAIYFICLLISDSITLLIGYIEMIDRESNMIDKSALLCIFNGKIIHTITDIIYTFMGRFCLEWMLYKVLWTRASTILLAILTVQRSRTFFSLSYHESRLCAFFACVTSILLASTITCLEWTGVQYDEVKNTQIYFQIFQAIIEKNSSKEFYITCLNRDSNQSNRTYPCLLQSINATSLSTVSHQSNCSTNGIALEFYNFTRALLSNPNPDIADTTSNLLVNRNLYDSNLSNKSLLIRTIEIAETPDIIGRLFEKRSCHITLRYSLWLKFYNFFNSVSFTWNRRTVAIFFGNALPSFIVVSANLLSLKVIYFSKSLKYLKETSRKNRRKRRLQNDLRAFLVILIESFSVILISWGIPILLTMYHCGTLYVVNISHCPQIKHYLALFLFTDLFNSSTNCLLYSLSGKLFRRKFVCVAKTILTCGRGTLWHVEEHSTNPNHQVLDRQPSTSNYLAGQSSTRPGSYYHVERSSSPARNNLNRKFNNSLKPILNDQHLNGQADETSLSMFKTSDGQNGGKYSSTDIESDSTKKSTEVHSRNNPSSIKSYIIDKVGFFRARNYPHGKSPSLAYPSTILSTTRKPTKSKRRVFGSILSRRRTTTNSSASSSSFTGSISRGSQRDRQLSRKQTGQNDVNDSFSIVDRHIAENLTSV